MQEIKFRVWDKKHKKMSLVDAIDFEHDEIYGKNGRERYTPKPFKDIEIMQYTGMTDKNGKEIYEGDILLSTASENEEDYKKWKVSYFDGGYIVNYKHIPIDKRKRSINEIELLCNDNIAFYEFEILGNIYENQELMEVADDK